MQSNWNKISLCLISKTSRARLWQCLFTTFFLAVWSGAAADDWYVSPAGDDNHTGASWGQAFKTIAKGVTIAQAGDTIWLSNGVYQADGTGHAGAGAGVGISMIGIAKAITLKGASGNPADVVLDGGHPDGMTNRLVYIDHPSALLAHLTVTNGYVTGNGAGVFLKQGIVSNCIVSGNTAITNGSGIYLSSANTTVTHCRVQGNVSSTEGWYQGAAIYVENGGYIAHCDILENTDTYRGTAGIALRRHGTIANCVFSNNTSPQHAALVLFGPMTAPVLVDSCDFINNTSSDAGHPVARINNCDDEFEKIFTNCNFYGNTAGSIYNDNSQLVTLTDCVFSNNTGNVSLFSSNTVVNCSFIGNYSTTHGGGLLLSGRDNVVSNCYFKGNNTALDGGAIATYYANAANNLITHCTVVSNTSNRSGGIVLLSQYSSDTVQNCYIAHNTASNSGGGIRANCGGGALLRNNLIISNTANVAGGIALDRPTTNENNVIAFNHATNPGGGVRVYALNNMFVNCIIISNTTASSDPNVCLIGSTTESNAFTYCCIPELINSGGNNIMGEPRWIAPLDGNFQLTADSPCINAGTNRAWMPAATDLAGRPRLDRFTQQVDMGCYEYLPRGAIFLFH